MSWGMCEEKWLGVGLFFLMGGLDDEFNLLLQNILQNKLKNYIIK